MDNGCADQLDEVTLIGGFEFSNYLTCDWDMQNKNISSLKSFLKNNGK